MYGRVQHLNHQLADFATAYLVRIRYIPLQTSSMPITYRKVSGSRNNIMPTILVSNIPPNRITGEPREIGAPALKVTYNPKVTALNANPIPVLAKIPETCACCGMPRAHCHSTQASPVESVQQPYININRLLEILFAASFTQRSAAANAHAVSAAYLIQPIIKMCPQWSTPLTVIVVKFNCGVPFRLFQRKHNRKRQ